MLTNHIDKEHRDMDPFLEDRVFFRLEVYHGQDKLVSSVVKQDSPSFDVQGLTAKTDYVVKVFRESSLGRSSPILLTAQTKEALNFIGSSAPSSSRVFSFLERQFISNFFNSSHGLVISVVFAVVIPGVVLVLSLRRLLSKKSSSSSNSSVVNEDATAVDMNAGHHYSNGMSGQNHVLTDDVSLVRDSHVHFFPDQHVCSQATQDINHALQSHHLESSLYSGSICSHTSSSPHRISSNLSFNHCPQRLVYGSLQTHSKCDPSLGSLTRSDLRRLQDNLNHTLICQTMFSSLQGNPDLISSHQNINDYLENTTCFPSNFSRDDDVTTGRDTNAVETETHYPPSIREEDDHHVLMTSSFHPNHHHSASPSRRMTKETSWPTTPCLDHHNDNIDGQTEYPRDSCHHHALSMQSQHIKAWVLNQGNSNLCNTNDVFGQKDSAIDDSHHNSHPFVQHPNGTEESLASKCKQNMLVCFHFI